MQQPKNRGCEYCYLFTSASTVCSTCTNGSNFKELVESTVAKSSFTTKISPLTITNPYPGIITGRIPSSVQAVTNTPKANYELPDDISSLPTIDNTLPVLDDTVLTKLASVKKGVKHDSGKLDWTLIPWKQLEPVVEVLEFGATKYSRDNWQKVERDRYEKAILRHIVSYVSGEKEDPESQKSHLAHVICNALFLMWNDDK